MRLNVACLRHVPCCHLTHLSRASQPVTSPGSSCGEDERPDDDKQIPGFPCSIGPVSTPGCVAGHRWTASRLDVGGGGSVSPVPLGLGVSALHQAYLLPLFCDERPPGENLTHSPAQHFFEFPLPRAVLMTRRGGRVLSRISPFHKVAPVVLARVPQLHRLRPSFFLPHPPQSLSACLEVCVLLHSVGRCLYH